MGAQSGSIMPSEPVDAGELDEIEVLNVLVVEVGLLSDVFGHRTTRQIFCFRFGYKRECPMKRELYMSL